jgi:hypothetical protein
MSKNKEKLSISKNELPEYLTAITELEDNIREMLKEAAEQREAIVVRCAKTFGQPISPEVVLLDCSEYWTTENLGAGMFSLNKEEGNRNITANCNKKDGTLAIHKLEHYTVIADIDQTTNGVLGIYLVDNEDLEEEEDYDDEDYDEDEDEDYEDDEEEEDDDEAEEEDDD